jgi:hypothetical protein
MGMLLLMLGVGCAVLAPAELVCFYWFSEGGRFHYPGFGFGSFMFAIIAVQILAYYVIAVVCVPLGYGHLKRRPWARTVSVAGLAFWLIVGLPLVIVFAVVFVLSKDPSLGSMLAALPLLAFLYPVVPLALLRFYRSRDVTLVFQGEHADACWTERLPLPLLVLCMLYAFWILALHTAVLFRGAFPFFGLLLTDLTGIVMIDAAVWLLVLLTCGTLQRQRWAWWGALAHFAVMTLSSMWTFARLSWVEMLDTMQFAPLEVEALDGIPTHGLHVAVFIGLPLLATLGWVIYCGRFFAPTCNWWKGESDDARRRYEHGGEQGAQWRCGHRPGDAVLGGHGAGATGRGSAGRDAGPDRHTLEPRGDRGSDALSAFCGSVAARACCPGPDTGRRCRAWPAPGAGAVELPLGLRRVGLGSHGHGGDG